MAVIKKYTKKDGSTAYQFDLYLGIDPMTGKKKRTTRRGFKTQKDAKLALATLELEVENGEFANSEKMTYQQVYDLWFKHYKNTVKESTYCKTEEQFRCRILPIFGHRYIDKIPVTICQQAIDQWATELVNFKVVMNYTSKIFEHAIKMGIAADNPTTKIIIPVKKQEAAVQKKLNYYSKDELKLFMECLSESKNTMAIMFFRLLAFTGIRRGECLALSWNDVNLTDGSLTISKTLAKGEGGKLIVQSPKTRTSARIISIDDKTLEELKKWRITQRELYFKLGYNTNQDNQLIFSNQENSYLQLTKPRKWLLQTIKKYNLKSIGLHGFRHTFASLCFEAGATIKEVQEMLGHSSYKMTLDIYTHVTESKRQETAEKFSKYVDI